MMMKSRNGLKLRTP